MSENENRQSLRIGDTAPDFTARSTVGEIRLSDYRGQWVMLFSHPADFTPVCTTEFVGLANAADKFAKMDCALLALSVDSLYSHFAWVRAIRDRYGVEVRFPIIEDPTLVIGRAYGMVAPEAHDSATVRTNFYIDPDGKIRASACYPLSIGRSVNEMIRVLAAMQAADATGNLAPEGWQPGGPMLAQSEHDLDSLFSDDDASKWFLAEKDT